MNVASRFYERLVPANPIERDRVMINACIVGSLAFIAAGLGAIAYGDANAERQGAYMPPGTQNLTDSSTEGYVYKVPSKSVAQADCGKLNRPLVPDSDYKKAVIFKTDKFTTIFCTRE